MRGKVAHRAQPHPAKGITPAYAGKSPFSAPPFIVNTGSPPRMRGKEAPAKTCAANYRITPAYAGKRADRKKPGAYAGDHPRVCGEKVILCCSCDAVQGSPPRMRGKVCVISVDVVNMRITPAYAGKRNATNS